MFQIIILTIYKNFSKNRRKINEYKLNDKFWNQQNISNNNNSFNNNELCISQIIVSKNNKIFFRGKILNNKNKFIL